MSGKEVKHIPVLCDQVIEAVRASDGGRFLDCTFGGGGHALAVLQANPNNIVVGIDRDAEAKNRLAAFEQYQDRFELVVTDFLGLHRFARGFGEVEAFDGIIADLGVSTFQLFSERGFSFREEQVLDMRMDLSSPLTAQDVVNEYEFGELRRVLQRGGVTRDASRLASAIVKARPILNTQKLAEIIKVNSSSKTHQKSSHPATVPFQAIRMEVNGELDQIKGILDIFPSLAKQGSRCAVITFHSGEDKLVTKKFRAWQNVDTAPANWPGRRTGRSLGKLVSNKAIVPDEQELEQNPASRSAKLRVFEFA